MKTDCQFFLSASNQLFHLLSKLKNAISSLLKFRKMFFIKGHQLFLKTNQSVLLSRDKTRLSIIITFPDKISWQIFWTA